MRMVLEISTMAATALIFGLVVVRGLGLGSVPNRDSLLR